MKGQIQGWGGAGLLESAQFCRAAFLQHALQDSGSDRGVLAEARQVLRQAALLGPGQQLLRVRHDDAH